MKKKKTHKTEGIAFVLMFLGLAQMVAAIAIRYFDQLTSLAKEE